MSSEPKAPSAPLFSVVVPAYNAEDTLAETLDALSAQSEPSWECVVVDDGSRDRTLEIARSYAASDVRFRAVHQDNAGTAGAYNRGVSEARGDWVVICSADDILLPEHLATLHSAIENEPGYDIYSTNGYRWDPEGERVLVYPGREEPFSFSLADVIMFCFYSVGAAYRRGLWDSVGGYRTGSFGEDYDFWLRSLARGARHRFVPAALSLHRVSATQKSANLAAAYSSDIRLLSDLRASERLSLRERFAIRRSIRIRQRYLKELPREEASS